MTEIGKAFEQIAYIIVKAHGMNSNKMATGYTLYEIDNYEVKERYSVEAGLLDQLVSMGYLRKFVGPVYLNNKGRNWRYRFNVRNVKFGLTAKGWAVAEQYIVAAVGKDEFKRLVDHHAGSVDTFTAPDFDEWLDGWDEYVNG